MNTALEANSQAPACLQIHGQPDPISMCASGLILKLAQATTVAHPAELSGSWFHCVCSTAWLGPDSAPQLPLGYKPLMSHNRAFTHSVWKLLRTVKSVIVSPRWPTPAFKFNLVCLSKARRMKVMGEAKESPSDCVGWLLKREGSCSKGQVSRRASAHGHC